MNAKDKRGTTALMYAAAYGSAEAVKVLLDAGADVNSRNAFDATALMWSVNDSGKVALLLAKGADVNAKSKMGRSPLLMRPLTIVAPRWSRCCWRKALRWMPGTSFKQQHSSRQRTEHCADADRKGSQCQCREHGWFDTADAGGEL